MEGEGPGNGQERAGVKVEYLPHVSVVSGLEFLVTF